MRTLSIEKLALEDGSLPPRVLGLVIEWAELHQKELMDNWQTIATTGTFKTVAPLV